MRRRSLRRPASTTVRLPIEARDKLRELAQSRNEPMENVLAAAVDLLARDQFFDELDRDFAALRANPGLWRQEIEERAAWHAIDRCERAVTSEARADLRS